MIDGKRAIAVVGCGGMGGGHAVAISTGSGTAIWKIQSVEGGVKLREGDTDISKKLVLAGTYDIAPDRQDWARAQGYHAYESFEDVLADSRVDIVLIATPNHLHKDQAIKAMRAGKHVLCEKPVMLSSDELIEVMAVAKETGKVFYPRQNRRWDEDYLIIKRIYDEKLVGEVFNIESRVHGSRGIPGDWRGVKKYGGGMMLDWGVHLLDRMLDMIPGKVKKVFAKMTHITNDDCDDGFKMHMTFESGITVVIEVGTCNFINLPLWYIAGVQGTAVVYNWQCEGKIVRLESWEDKDAVPILAGEGLTKTMAPRIGDSITEFELPKVIFDSNELYSNLVDVVDGLESGAAVKQIVTCEEALRCLKLMEAAFESDEKGAVIDFE
ncbi:MAG: Gfo/Idh/MocA family oxidoreductase [Oscillospiraceae bacterium]|nr:Gfo/Idh/MocA family oxidoreductase [Oscillospiraceae bacterium]